jgi:hypothetical protein
MDELKPLKKESARAFRLELQAARENALKDAEAFDGIIYVVERLGMFLKGAEGDLGKYAAKICLLAQLSPLASGCRREWHTPFVLLHTMVRKARNDALHIGAFARHLTTHTIELALVLEDALRTIENTMKKQVSDYMIRNPLCAQLWQPISFIRQIILTNSFSYLPVLRQDKAWCLVSDLQIAWYLQQADSNRDRKGALARPLGETGIKLLDARLTCQNMSIDEVLTYETDNRPLLVRRCGTHDELAGILTPFDLL